MGHDRFGSTPAPFEPSFQSTRPARDATRHILIGPHPCCSFNPRARGGRDATAPPRSVMHSHVSIHAPAGGATQKTISTRDENSSVSIHAPAGGATDKGQLVARHRVVSIHAPAGGATPSAGKKKPPCARFNPRARGGRDKGTVWAIKRILSFNPRARGGRDKAPSRIWTHQLLFQSTRPRGARLLRRPALLAVELVSIHAPAGGATIGEMRAAGIPDVSIHAPAGGATLGYEHLAILAFRVSIHAPAGGATYSAMCAP